MVVVARVKAAVEVRAVVVARVREVDKVQGKVRGVARVVEEVWDPAANVFVPNAVPLSLISKDNLASI